MGYPMERITRVNNFRESLHRQYDEPLKTGKKPSEIPPPSFDLVPDIPYELIRPKGKNAADMRDAYDPTGQPVRVGKHGFYLRPSFVARILLAGR